MPLTPIIGNYKVRRGASYNGIMFIKNCVRQTV